MDLASRLDKDCVRTRCFGGHGSKVVALCAVRGGCCSRLALVSQSLLLATHEELECFVGSRLLDT